jgi:predicted HicB family RNase H-like nuclease
MTPKKEKSINIKINTDLHKDIKIAAAKRNISISLWVTRLLIAGVNNEKKYDYEQGAEENNKT